MEKSLKTPCYAVSFETFEKNCREVMDSFQKEWGSNIAFGYSVKTNHDAKLMAYAHDRLSWFIETVSPDEYMYAESLGFEGKDIILNGPCKQDTLYTALEEGAYVNLDSLDEVEKLCSYDGSFASSRIGLRVNFDLEKKCPGETTAGSSCSRFGIDCTNGDFGKAVDMLKSAGIRVAGLHMHTSTKSRSLNVFGELAAQVVRLVKEYGLELDFVDMGGGFFGGQKVAGKPDMPQYAYTICTLLKSAIDAERTKLILEPGASVIATCATYETTVLSVRDIRGTRIVTTDGTLLHINPFMAHRSQKFECSDANGRDIIASQIVCGCTCMENDRFAVLENEPELKPGDRLSFLYAGAYTMAFNSSFIINPPEVEYLNTDL